VSMSKVRPLGPEFLCQDCDPEQFPFETTASLEPLTEVIGQERAIEAMRFGIGIHREGYNLFAMGSHGTGKYSAIRQFLDEKAAAEPVPSDWCYVNNFQEPYKPEALQLSPGQGASLCGDMQKLVEALHSVIPAAFEGEDYQTLAQAIEEEFAKRQEQAFNELRAQGQDRGLALIRTQVGWGFAPTQAGQVISPEEFQRLSETDQERLKEGAAEMDKQLQATLHQFQVWEGERRERIKALNRGVTGMAVDHLIDDLRQKYEAYAEVVAYLDAVQSDIIENADDFRKAEPGSEITLPGVPLPRAAQGPPSFRRYQVNVLVNHAEAQGAPVVYEDHPTYSRLFGQIEHTLAQSGVLVTDFNLIKAGALHQANGGYLIVDARKLLQQPYVWEQLKRALRANQIVIESPTQMVGLASTVSLNPEPIPLSVKIILLGDRLLYYMLHQLDPDFGELFKVAVDFADEMERSPENNLRYAQLIGKLINKEGLRHFDRAAVARIIEHSARLAGHSRKLSMRIQGVADLLREADYWAGEAGRDVAGVDDVQRAIEAQIYRVDRVREQAQEQIEEETILIDTDGAKVGQVNGLSVLAIGNFAFGRPTRISARVRPGKGEVVDIEREVALGGPLHSKGVLILASFLGARYAPNRPLSLSASLVFEQSYGGVDGDSASSTELYALLSALADVPIKQSLAVTGSVNQHGQVQAIGGVNEKIEGFFDLCWSRGLTGEQGVLIPASNVKHLMLRRDVIEAAMADQFYIYPVKTIDDGIEILTGMPAGERDEAGNFPPGSLNQRVEARLMALAETWQSFNTTTGMLKDG
jgi:lon-related putative ATP-dependent protease